MQVVSGGRLDAHCASASEHLYPYLLLLAPGTPKQDLSHLEEGIKKELGAGRDMTPFVRNVALQCQCRTCEGTETDSCLAAADWSCETMPPLTGATPCFSRLCCSRATILASGCPIIMRVSNARIHPSDGT
jgi:hypothetical protein